jgi:Rod binding domain-containing protein
MPNGINAFADMMVRQTAMSAQGRKKIDSRDHAGMEKACKDFESLFVTYLMKEMRDTIPENELFGGGSAEKIYTSMLDGEVAKHVSNQRSIGLSDMLLDQMIKTRGKK